MIEMLCVLQVSEMVLCSERRRVHSAGSPETSGRTGEESDSEYRSGDEGGSQHNGSESSVSDEVSSSSSVHMEGVAVEEEARRTT